MYSSLMHWHGLRCRLYRGERLVEVCLVRPNDLLQQLRAIRPNPCPVHLGPEAPEPRIGVFLPGLDCGPVDAFVPAGRQRACAAAPAVEDRGVAGKMTVEAVCTMPSGVSTQRSERTVERWSRSPATKWCLNDSSWP